MTPLSHTDRVQWIDYIKAFCIMSVILNHHYGPQLYGLLTYPYELVGFFFVAGYTYNVKISFGEFISRKTRTLLVPFLIFGVINAILGSLFKTATPLHDRLLGLLIQTPGKWDDLWFLACLFTMEIIYFPISRFHSHFGRHVCVLSLFIICCIYSYFCDTMIPWHLQNALFLLPFIHLGSSLRSNECFTSWMQEMRGSKRLVIPIILIGISYIFTSILFKNYPIDIHILEYGSNLGFVITATLGLSFIFMGSLYLEKYKTTHCMTAINYIGMNTLIFYAFQSKSITFISRVLAIIGISSSSYLGALVSCCIVVMILSLISFIIVNYCPWIIGRRKTFVAD